MAEILLRVVDKTNSDPVLNRQCPKAGDVVTVQEDDWPWSATEQTNPDWRIVKLPGVSVVSFLDMLVPSYQGTGANEVIVRRRRKMIDITGVSAQTLLASGQVIILALHAQQDSFSALKSAKPVVDVVVIG